MQLKAQALTSLRAAVIKDFGAKAAAVFSDADILMLGAKLLQWNALGLKHAANKKLMEQKQAL